MFVGQGRKVRPFFPAKQQLGSAAAPVLLLHWHAQNGWGKSTKCVSNNTNARLDAKT